MRSFVVGVVVCSLLSFACSKKKIDPSAYDAGAAAVVVPSAASATTALEPVNEVPPLVPLTPVKEARPVPAEARDIVVIEEHTAIKDGASETWKLPPGNYELDLTATDRGVTIEWTGPACKGVSKETKIFHSASCVFTRDGQLTIENPSTFGMGAVSVVALKVTRLVDDPSCVACGYGRQCSPFVLAGNFNEPVPAGVTCCRPIADEGGACTHWYEENAKRADAKERKISW